MKVTIVINTDNVSWATVERDNIHDDCIQPYTPSIAAIAVMDAMEFELDTPDYLEEMAKIILEATKRYDTCVKNLVSKS